MTILNVRHTTVYRYSRPVRLGAHRLMLRPRDSHDLRLIQTSLKITPAASLRWLYDVFGNSVAIASFAEPAAELRIESNLQIETFVVERPAFQITPDAVSGTAPLQCILRSGPSREARRRLNTVESLVKGDKS